MITRTRRLGFTIVELLTAVAIIAMLIALLVPSLSMVRKFANETRQKAQLAAIGQALMAFRTDYGDYPPSEARDIGGQPYCGAQKLAEALLGWDLLGFQPSSAANNWGQTFRSDGAIYNPAYLDERRGPYLDVGTTNAFSLDQLFGSAVPMGSNPRTYVLCDSFPVRNVSVGQPGNEKTVKAGTPILYYRAHTDRMDWGTAAETTNSTRYDYRDNQALCSAPALTNRNLLFPDPDKRHPFEYGFRGAPLGPGEVFYCWDAANLKVIYKLIDLQVWQASGRFWPHRPDSYILISAGADGLYGTSDDITNFGN